MQRPGSHRRLAFTAAMVLSVLVGLAPSSAMAARGQEATPPDPSDPLISIFWPPLAVANVGIPSEHLHLKLNQAWSIETEPIHVCLPGAGFQGILPWIHLIWKPDGLAPPSLGTVVDLITQMTDDESDDAWDDVGDLPSVGTVGVPVPRDRLGDYELEVFCVEFTTTLPPVFKLGRTSTAYSVEPYPYVTYVWSEHEKSDEDHAGPVAFWRMGDLPKGSRTLADSAGDHDGTYYADGGVHPALDRDGAPNCNVEGRATSGCNDGTVRTTSSVTQSVQARVATDDFFLAGHGFTNDQIVRLNGVDTVTGVANGTYEAGPFYFVRDATADTFKLAAWRGTPALPPDIPATAGGDAILLEGSDDAVTVISDSATAVNSGIVSPVVSDNDRAAFFTGGQYAAVQDFAAITSAYTIEAWVQPRVVKDMMIFQHGYGPALYIDNGAFVFRQTDTDVVQGSGDMPAAGEWSHVVGTWDGATTARLYVDGEQVGVSTSAGKTPSGGGSTLYIGGGEIIGGATFDGSLDEVALYAEELPAAGIALHHEIGTYVQPAQSIINPLEYYLDVTRPKVEVSFPTEGAIFPAAKLPAASEMEYVKSDPDGLLLDGVVGGDIVVCVPVRTGASFSVTCTDRGLNVKTVSHGYTVGTFPDVVMNPQDDAIGYWRLGDAQDSSVMEGYGTLPDGEYKNDTEGGPEGISGDADTTRAFLGEGGYGYVNGIEHPKWSYSMEAWVALDDTADAMIMQHGRGGALFVKDGNLVFRQTVTDVTWPATGLDDGDFHQVVGTWDGVYARLYVDGRQKGDAVFAPTPPSGFSTFYVAYGEYAPWLRGEMDEVSYYGNALSAGRVLEHFVSDPPPAEVPKDDLDTAKPTGSSWPASSAPSTRSLVRPAIVRLRKTARVSERAGRLVATLPLSVRCPAAATAPCRVTATATRRFGPTIGARAGRVRKDVAAGQRWTVRMKLTPSAARSLRKAGRQKLSVRVKVRAPGGALTTRTANVTLRLP